MPVEMEITIINRLGLHARACAKLVKAAAHYESRIEPVSYTHLRAHET